MSSKKTSETMIPKLKALKGIKRISPLDIPESLWEVITEDANKQRRTMRAQIIFLLEQYYINELTKKKEEAQQSTNPCN